MISVRKPDGITAREMCSQVLGKETRENVTLEVSGVWEKFFAS